MPGLVYDHVVHPEVDDDFGHILVVGFDQGLRKRLFIEHFMAEILDDAMHLQVDLREIEHSSIDFQPEIILLEQKDAVEALVVDVFLRLLVLLILFAGAP